MVVQVYDFLFDALEGFLGKRRDEEDGRKRAALIDQCREANRRVLRCAIEAACKKLHDYHAETRAGMYAIAVILDPRVKMAY